MTSLRFLMPALNNKHYFNYGGQGPLPTPSLNAIKASWEKIQEIGPFTNDVWPYIAKEIEETRIKLSKICGVRKQQIAFTENVTSGCVLPLLGLPFSAGDRLLISDCEHPGVVSACKELAKRKNLSIDIFPIQTLKNNVTEGSAGHETFLNRLDMAINPKTKLVVLSHLLWNSGLIIPIPSVAAKLKDHKNKPFLLVDAAQSFGQIPVENAACCSDIYAFTSHKWACGPEGLGGVALSERVLEEAKPTLIGWRSLKSEGSIYETNENPFHNDSRRFEVATSCIPLLAGLRTSLNLLEDEGTILERMQHITNLSSELWSDLNNSKGVQPILKEPPPSGLVSFLKGSKSSQKEIVKILGKQGIWIRVLEDPAWLRACVHVTTNSAEIKKLVAALSDLH